MTVFMEVAHREGPAPWELPQSLCRQPGMPGLAAERPGVQQMCQVGEQSKR